MHELSVCQALVQQLESVSAGHGGGRVELVRLRVGPLAGVEAALLRHAFPIAAAGSIAEGAELLVQEAPVVVQCNECGERSEVAPNRLLCNSCQGFRVRVVSGQELLLESVELAAPAATPTEMV